MDQKTIEIIKSNVWMREKRKKSNRRDEVAQRKLSPLGRIPLKFPLRTSNFV